MKKFNLYHQLDTMDCGSSCLRMVVKHYGRDLSAQELREAAEIGKDGNVVWPFSKIAPDNTQGYFGRLIPKDYLPSYLK